MTSGLSSNGSGAVRPRSRRFRAIEPLTTGLFALGAAVIIFMGWVSYRNITSLIETSSWVFHTEEAIGGIDSLFYRVSAAETAHSRYILTGDPSALETYRGHLLELESSYRRLTQLIAENPAQMERLHAVRTLVDERIREMEEAVHRRTADGRASESLRRTVQQEGFHTEPIRDRLAEMETAEQKLLRSRIEQRRQDAESARRAIQVGGFFALVCVLLAGAALSGDIRRRMRIEQVLERTNSLQRAILNSANYAILSTDARGTVVTFNAAAESMLGYSAPELVGKLTPVVLHEPSELARHAAQLSRELRRTIEPGFHSLTARARMGIVDESEWTYFRRDGTRFPGLLSVSTMHDEDGMITGFVFIIGDIGLRKEAERARLVTERRYRALLQNSSDIVSVLDPLGSIQYVSPAVNRLLGYTVEELAGQDVFTYVHPEEVESARQSFYNTAMRPGYAAPLEVRLRNSVGRYIYVEIIANNLLHDEVLHGIVINARDVSERKRARSHMELQNAVAHVLAQAETREESTAQVLQTLCRTLEFDIGEYWAVDFQDDSLNYETYWADPGIDAAEFAAVGRLLKLRRGESFCGAAWAQGSAIFSGDLPQDRGFIRRPEAQALSLQSGIAFPAQTKGRVIGIVVLYSRSVQQPDPDLLAILDAIGKQVGQFVARRSAEEEIKRNEERYRYLFDSATDLIYSITPDHRLLHVNAACVQSLGYTREELGNMYIFDILPVEEHDHFRTIMQQAFSGNTLGKVETVLLSRSGQKILVEGSVNGRIVDGRVLYCNAIFHDVTRRREVENMKNEFISVVSHELRTPLTSIRGSLGLLAGGLLRSDPEKGGRMLEIALKNTERLVRLINDILDIEKIESGRTALDLQPHDAADMLHQAAATMNTMAEANGIRLEVRAEPGTLIADRDRLIQTLTNLLSNAIKFSNPGSPVWLTSTSVGNDLLIQVRDVGRGIPANKLEAIFERFQQVDASDSRRKGGTGLGLAICRSIAQQHGGTIWAESQEGSGSVFSVRLPRFQPRLADGSRGDEKAVVLLCGDGPLLFEELSGLLRSRGCQVIAGEGKQGAVTAALGGSPHAILLDLQTTAGDAWEGLTGLRAHPATARIPVVLLSEDPFKFLQAVGEGLQDPPLPRELLFHVLSRGLSIPSAPLRILLLEDDAARAKGIVSLFSTPDVHFLSASTVQEATGLCATQPDLLLAKLNLALEDGCAFVRHLNEHELLSRSPLMVYSASGWHRGKSNNLEVSPEESHAAIRARDVVREQLAVLLQEVVETRREFSDESKAHTGRG